MRVKGFPLFLKGHISIFFLILAMAGLTNAECVVTKRTCVDASGEKLINGIPYTVDCWEYEEEKTCFVADDSTDGCATLNKDVASKGAGGCRMLESVCTDSVTSAEGKTTCLKEQELYRCDNKIEIPSSNVTSNGVVTDITISQDEKACATWISSSECKKTKEEADGTNLLRTYSCSDINWTGCTDLAKNGCARIKAPACDETYDSTCAMLVGRMRCPTLVYQEFIEKGQAEYVSQVKRAATRGVRDESSVKALENSTTTCEVTSSECTDSTAGYRSVNGARIYSACWGYTDTVLCKDTAVESTCISLEENEKCALASNACDSTGTDGSCAHESNTYICSDTFDNISAGKAKLVQEEKTVSSWRENVNCEKEVDYNQCYKSSETCSSANNENRTVDGVSVTKDCWQKTQTYTCNTGAKTVTVDNCTEYANNQACTLETEECSEKDSDGNCLTTKRKYLCRPDVS